MGNLNRYSVTVWAQCPDERRGTMRIASEHGFRRASSAYRYARRMMRAPVVTTRGMHHIDTRGASWADVADTGRTVGTVAQSVEFVPSVGELGCTP